jgi:isoleucyl-tRNA synthetase
VVPRLLKAIDDLTNWYIRFNRKRLKGLSGLGLDDTKDALNTLFEVLFTLVRALAPFIPFITEHIYDLLRKYLPDEILSSFSDSRSVHFLQIPTVREALFDADIERGVSAMQKVIELGRKARDKRTIALKVPVLTLVVISDSQILADVDSLKTYVEEELNVRNVILTTDEEKYNIVLEAKVDWPTLGKKLKKDVQKVKKALPNLTQDQLRSFLKEKTISIDGIELGEEDLNIVRSLGPDSSKAADGADWEAAFTTDAIVLMDCASHPELANEGLARDLVNRVQKLRKRANLVPTDDIRMEYKVVANPDQIDVADVIKSQEKVFINALRGNLGPIKEDDPADSLIAEEEQEVRGLIILLRLAKL